MSNLAVKVGLFGRSLTNQISDSKLIELIYTLMANHICIAFTVSALPHLLYIILLDIFYLIVGTYNTINRI